KDICGYSGYARLGARHGVDPYTHGVFLFPGDPVFRYAAWTHVASAYGPLFTVATYPLAFVSVPVAMWTIKVVTAIASLGLVWLIWYCAERTGRDPLQAVIMAYAAFGSGATGQFKVLKRQQLLVSGDAIPTQLGNFLGLGGVTSDVRLVSRLVGIAALAYLLWRVWRGTMDWIVATGWAMLLTVVTSSWLLGWYFLWPLPFA